MSEITDCSVLHQTIVLVLLCAALLNLRKFNITVLTNVLWYFINDARNLHIVYVCVENMCFLHLKSVYFNIS